MLEVPDIAGVLSKSPRLDIPVFKEKYLQEGLSIRQVASLQLCSKEAVRANLEKAGIERRSKNFHNGNPAQLKFGTKKRNGRPVRNLSEQRVIQTVRDMRGVGMSLRQIAKFLSQIGVPTKNRGKKWHPQMVKRIIDT